MKILIVDDQAFNREIIQFYLEQNGHSCIHAEHGEQACERVKQDADIELILMDVNMPVMNGKLAAKKIKSGIGNRLLPVIFITVLDNEDTLEECLQAGGDDFLSKPVSEKALIAKLNAHKRTIDLFDALSHANQALQLHAEKTEKEHVIVDNVFQRGLNRAPTRCTNITSYSSPKSMFNGDIVLEAPSPDGGIYLMVGDFTGHGLSAAIGALPVSDIFFRMSAEGADVAHIARSINATLLKLLPEDMFLCAAISYLDQTGQHFSYWLGGMNDIYVVDDNKQFNRLKSEHMPLGVLADGEFDDSAITIQPEKNSHIYIYTDGIVEAENASGDYFGSHRLEKILQKGSKYKVPMVCKEVHDFVDNTNMSDDISIAELHFSAVNHVDKA